MRSSRLRASVLAGAMAAAAPAFAQTEIQWWHAMTGANNDVIVKLANEFNAAQKDYKVVADLQGQLPRHHERRHRRVPRRQPAAHHAGVRGRHRDDDGGQGRRQAGTGPDEGSRRNVRPQDVSAGDHRLLLDVQGRDAVVPVQLVVDGDVAQQGQAARRPASTPAAAEDLAGRVRRRQEAARQRSPRPAASRPPGPPGRTSSSSRRGTTCRCRPRPTASTASTPS